MAGSARMRVLSWLWLGVPAFGLLEFGAHLYCAQRAPAADEWQTLRPAVEALRTDEELVVVAPDWAEPLARQSLGDSLMPIEQVARADETAYPRAIEISAMGNRAPELRGWREVSRERVGRFSLRVLENPRPVTVQFDFVNGLQPSSVVVREVRGAESSPCVWRRAVPLAGGLHGHAAFPGQRFVCRGGVDQFVGVTVVEDQEYRPRLCVWAEPPREGSREIRYRDVKLGHVIRGYSRSSWFLTRDGGREPIELVIRVGEEVVGTVVHYDEEGWGGKEGSFEFSLGARAQTRADVTFEVRTDDPGERQFCFQADTR